MMTPAKQAELRELTDAVCEGRLNAADAGRLEGLLRGDRLAQALYLQHVHLCGALRWDLGQAAERDALKALKAQFGRETPPSLRRDRSAGNRPAARRRFFALAGAAAAAVLVALLFGLGPRPRPIVPKAPAFAVLAQSIDATWEQDAARPAVGERLGGSKLRLQTGLARIDFDHGTSVTLEGPAEFDLLDSNRGFLRHGRLTTKVPSRAPGFCLDTPGWQMADRDTSFGVAVEPTGAAEVCVFEGQVEVAPAGPTRAPKRRLKEGNAARIDRGQSEMRPMDFDPSRYARSWPVTLGVLYSDGVVQFVPPGAGRVPRRFADDHHLIVFPEREEVTLPADVLATTDAVGRHEGPFEGQAAVLTAGTRGRSYLLQFNPLGQGKGQVRRLTGSITFDRPVLGLIATTVQLAATDAILGAEGSNPDDRARGIEAGDAFELSADRHTLHVDWTAAVGIDQLRVVVAGP
jgi:hypothetical protein